MTNILAVSGSLRAGSLNTALARAAQSAVPQGVQVEVATLHGVPLYDGDLEMREGVPASVLALKERIIDADGLLLVTPEYNNGVPGVFKNAIDWLSRADRAAVFAGRPVGLIGATPGGFGTVSAQYAWLPTLRMLGTQLYAGGRVLVPKADAAFDADGNLADENTRNQLVDYLAGFSTFVRAHSRRA